MESLQDLGPLGAGLLVTSLSAAMLYGLRISRPPDVLRMAFKATSTASLSLLCAPNGRPWLLVVALALCAVGDAFLAWPGERTFLFGLCSFLIAHIFYARLFLQFGGVTRLILGESWRRNIGAAILALAPVMGFLLEPRVGPPLRLPIALYSAVSLCMISTALTISTSIRSLAPSCSCFQTVFWELMSSWYLPTSNIASGCNTLSGYCTMAVNCLFCPDFRHKLPHIQIKQF